MIRDAKLSPGLYDAGETAMGMKHLLLLKKPDAFQLGTDNADDPKVQKTLGLLGIGDTSKMPKPRSWCLLSSRLPIRTLRSRAITCSREIFTASTSMTSPTRQRRSLLTSMVCPGGQGDVSVYKNLMFMSVEMPNGRLDCGAQGFPPELPPAAGQDKTSGHPAAQKDRFRGVRIFDISDIQESEAGRRRADLPRLAHAHAGHRSEGQEQRLHLRLRHSFVRQNEELAGCSGGNPDKDPNTALFRIDVIKVPLAAPQNAKIVSSPRIFMDPRTGVVNGLNNGGTHGNDRRESRPTPTSATTSPSIRRSASRPARAPATESCSTSKTRPIRNASTP